MTRHLSTLFVVTTTACVLLGTGNLNAQTFTFDVIDDTFISTNGGVTGDTEDNFGGRTENIGGSNASTANFRDMLLRFDVSAAAAAINNPALIVVDATLTFNPRDERSGIQPSNDAVLGVYGLLAGNEGWYEGTHAGSGGGLTGQFGSVSARFRSTPSSFSIDARPGLEMPDTPVDTDGLQWVSQGGGATVTAPDSLFDVALDTSNEILGMGDTNAIDILGGTDWDITMDGPTLDPFMDEWLAAPLMDDGDGGMQTSNAGLVITQESGTAGQWFFESIEGRPEEAPTLTVTFGLAPVPGDVDGDGLVNSVDYDIILANFFTVQTEREMGDLVNNDFIDLDDYLQWKTAPHDPDPPGAAGIPEPTSALLFLLAIVGLGFVRRR